MYGALTVPNIPTSTALVPSASTDMVVMDNDTQGNSLAPMSPMDSLKAIFEEIRDGINELVTLAYTGPIPDKDDAIGDADADTGDTEGPGETDSQGNDKGFSFPSIPKPGPKLGLALLLGGFATLMAFGDKMVPYIAPVLKFIKEKALPFAIDAFKQAFEGIKNVFNYAYENIWPFIRDNVIMSAIDYVKDTFQGIKDLFSDLGDRFGVLFSEDATWWEKISAFLGIFTDIGQFFIDQFDRVTEFIANVFGVSFDPYDGLISYISGKLSEGFQIVRDFFSAAGTFLLDGYKGISSWIDDKVTAAFAAVGDFFMQFGSFMIDGFTGIWDWIKSKVSASFAAIGDFFAQFGSFMLDGATGIWDWIKSKVMASFAAVGDFFSQMGSFMLDGASGLWDWITGKIGGAWDVITEWFGFGSEEESGDPPFSIGGWIMDKASELWNKLTSFFSFEDITGMLPSLPNIGDAFMNMVGGMLPSPDSFIGKGLYALPGTDTLKMAAEAFEAGGVVQDGVLTMPQAVEAGIVAPNPTNGEILSEGSKEVGAGSNVVTTITTTDASTTNNSQNNTTNTGELSVDGTDQLSRQLAGAGI